MSGIIKPYFGTPLNRAHPLSAGLVGCWLFSEGSGNRAWDASGCENHGTLIGMNDPPIATSGWGPGPHGGALAFDGLDDCVSIADSPTVRQSGNFSISSWVYLTSPQVIYGTIISKEGTTGWLNYRLLIKSDLKILFQVETSSTTFVSILTTPTLALNTLYHVTALFIASTVNGAKIYINGIEVAVTGTNNAGVPVTGAFPVYIGKYRSGTTDYYKLIGNLTNLSLFNRALSAEEIAYLYAFPYCMFEEAAYPAWMVPNNIPALANYYRQMRAA